MVQSSTAIFILTTLLISPQIDAQTPGKCEAGKLTNPLQQCQTIRDCYATEETYLAALASKFLVWCDKVGGVCCEGKASQNYDHTCTDNITPIFGEETCAVDEAEPCVNSRQETGECRSHRCCPSFLLLSVDHDFQPNILCNSSLPLPLTYENAYCTQEGRVQYFENSRAVDESQPCETSADCVVAQDDAAVCINRETPAIRFCYSPKSVAAAEESSSSAFWIIVGVLIAVPLVIIIMCVSTCIFCIEFIFCIVVVGVVLAFIGLAATLGASFYGGYLHLPRTAYEFRNTFSAVGAVEAEMAVFIVASICFMIFCLMSMVLIRWYYRKKLEKKLVEIHQQFEPNRSYLVEKRPNEAEHVRPIPLSPPISDQTEYNIVAAALKDDKKRQLF